MKTESSSSSFSASHQSSSSNSSSSNMNKSGSNSTALDHFNSRVPLTLRDSFFADPFFKNAWEDFEKIQREMMRQSQEFWAKVRKDNAAMFGNSDNMIKMDDDKFWDSDEMMMTPFFTPRRWMMPRLMAPKFESSGFDMGKLDFPSDFFSSSNSSFPNFGVKEDQVLRVKDDDSKFELSMDTQGYRPDEIKVNVHGDTLSVEAKHEEKGDNKFVSRQFSRKYTLPQGCEGHRVVSNLSSDGILMVTAPKRQAIKTDVGSRPVPIEMKK